MPSSFTRARLISHEQGQRLNVLGDQQRVVLTGEDTGGRYALIENANAPGMSIPPHLHRNEDEMFYVLEGEVEFQIGEQIVRASAGTTIHLPRQTPHAFTIVGAQPARMLILLVPAGLEKYFEELSRLPSEGPPNMATVAAISARYGVEFLDASQGAPAAS